MTVEIPRMHNQESAFGNLTLTDIMKIREGMINNLTLLKTCVKGCRNGTYEGYKGDKYRELWRAMIFYKLNRHDSDQ